MYRCVKSCLPPFGVLPPGSARCDRVLSRLVNQCSAQRSHQRMRFAQRAMVIGFAKHQIDWQGNLTTLSKLRGNAPDRSRRRNRNERALQGVGRVDPDPIFVGGKAEERPTSMMTALVLICSLAKTPLAMDCGTDNAVDVLKVPGEYSSLVTCFTRAQAFIGESRYELAVDHYLKVACGKPRLPANVA
jgi:hypothetical protein